MSFSKVLGSTLIVSGTAIGAGMLALPIVSGRIGFWPAEIILVCIWLLMTYTALLVLEVTLPLPDYKNNFNSMAMSTVGRAGQVLAWICVCLLLYSLTCAYISGASSLVSELGNQIFHIKIPSVVSALVFTFLFGSVVFASTQAVDWLNRGLMSIKGLSLILALSLLMPTIHGAYLSSHHLEQLSLLAAVPIFLTSFGFHTVIPSISTYLKKDVRALKKAIIWGSTLPFLIYTVYLICTLGLIPAHGANSFDTLHQHHDSVGFFVQLLDRKASSHWVHFAIQLFSNVAMTTSFLGVTLGLFDFLTDGFKRQNKRSHRFQIALLTFVPPLLIAFIYPNGFIIALGYAAIFVCLLEVILPAAMSFKARQKNKGYQPWGGGFLLLVVLLAGLGIIGIEVLKAFTA